jgi:predicted Zn-dependent peptidase
MADRFTLPDVGPLATVRFPRIERDILPNGLRLWSIPRRELPAVTAGLVINHGTSADPADRPGLTSLVADMVDEGAGGRDSIALADALARIGALINIEIGSDATTIALTTLSRFFDRALALLADIAMRPHLTDTDFRRVRELRQSRIRQVSQSASAAADRVFLKAVFGSHPYGHGQLGTIAALEALTVDDARRHWERLFTPSAATLIVVGDVTEALALKAASNAFMGWAPAASALAPPAIEPPAPAGGPEILIASRPGASQSELRVGHLGPPRNVDGYHAIVTLNAILGGQFTSRINRNLRETRGITYGAASTFEMRRAGGSFSCSTGVQSSATAEAASEILAEFAAIRRDENVTEDELSLAKASLTRGYVRQFETTAQLGRAAVVLATYGLDDGTFDRFVPGVDAVTARDLAAAAHRYIDPDRATVVIVGDEQQSRPGLEELGRPVRVVVPEF